MSAPWRLWPLGLGTYRNGSSIPASFTRIPLFRVASGSSHAPGHEDARARSGQKGPLLHWSWGDISNGYRIPDQYDICCSRMAAPFVVVSLVAINERVQFSPVGIGVFERRELR